MDQNEAGFYKQGIPVCPCHTTFGLPVLFEAACHASGNNLRPLIAENPSLPSESNLKV